MRKTKTKQKQQWKSLAEIRQEKQARKQQSENEQSVISHLTELRKRLMFVVVAFLGITIFAFLFIQDINNELLSIGIDSGFDFVYLAPSEMLVSSLKAALIVSFMLNIPHILFQIWSFTVPALEKTEKKVTGFCLLGGLIFFFLGSAFCYFIVIPMSIQFFATYSSGLMVTASISYQNYLNFLISMIMTFGLVFEIPIVTLLLSQFGILKPKFLTKIRKFAILIIFILSAIITPPDIVSQILIGVPMIILYEFSIILCRITYRRKKQKEADEMAA